MFLVGLLLLLPILVQGLNLGNLFNNFISVGAQNDFTVARNEGTDSEILETARFFTESFWAGKVGTSGRQGSNELTSSQFNLLLSTQISEFRKKYGTKRWKRGSETAQLLICKSNDEKQIMGCVGIERMTADAISMGAKRKGKGLMQAQATLEGAPLMSNLVVGQNYRRKGIAEELVKTAEAIAKDKWGCKDCFLYVDQQNSPAMNLYKKLGYKIESVDDSATILAPGSKGTLAQIPKVIVCMRKIL